MNKITAEHLARDAYVYMRQSTVDQLLNNPESRRRQYALVERARSLGWENVVVVDDDLGRSGSGQRRPGFERLLAAICAGTAGAVLAIEASRLARNGRDWHTLLEFCAFVNTLIIDEDGISDPRVMNDRLLLGLKGAFSELELAMFRQRSREALRLKAARGELHTMAAIGYRRGADGRLEQDPDRRIHETLSMVFRKFGEIGSVRHPPSPPSSLLPFPPPPLSLPSALPLPPPPLSFFLSPPPPPHSPYGCGRRGSSCRSPSMVPRAGPCSGVRRTTMRFTGC